MTIGKPTALRIRGRATPSLCALAVAAALSGVWLLLPPTGSDLSAQVAHADFAGGHLNTPIDMRWFGGTNWLGYSVLAPPMMAALGVRLVGALATSMSAGLLGALMSRCRVPHPLAGAAVGTLCLVANLVVGRLTFAIGTAMALATLVALTTAHWSRFVALVVGPVATWAASPLAALFVALVGLTVLMRGRRRREGLVLTVAAFGALAVSAWLGQGGRMPDPVDRVLAGVVVCCVVAVATAYPMVRLGSILAAVGLALSLLVDTQVGMNALRLPALFAAPVAMATSRLRLRVLVPTVAVTICLVPPITADDVTATGELGNDSSYYTELLHELHSLPLSGRLEIPPTLQRWESVYVARQFPLARGWMTQLDAGYNSLFFGSTLSPAAYRHWLHDNAVQYVAVSDATPAEAGVAETSLIKSGAPYLHRLWTGTHWTIYRVADARAIVTGGVLLSQGPTSVVFRAAANTVAVRVRWSRWLTLAGPGGCLRRDGDWTYVEVHPPGVYRLSSALIPTDGHRMCTSRPG
jgi:hypothetical protein